MANYLSLRDANTARQYEWDPKGHAKDWSWRCNELAGEGGEVCNILKKLHREHLGIPGSRATKDQLADELGDVVICADLCAMHAGVGEPILFDESRYEASVASLPKLGTLLAARIGKLCDLHRDDMDVRHAIGRVLRIVGIIAVTSHVDLEMAVAKKFNETSHKVGLKTTFRLLSDELLDGHDGTLAR